LTSGRRSFRAASCRKERSYLGIGRYVQDCAGCGTVMADGGTLLKIVEMRYLSEPGGALDISMFAGVAAPEFLIRQFSRRIFDHPHRLNFFVPVTEVIPWIYAQRTAKGARGELLPIKDNLWRVIHAETLSLYRIALRATQTSGQQPLGDFRLTSEIEMVC
jgi:hypothetical protein